VHTGLAAEEMESYHDYCCNTDDVVDTSAAEDIVAAAVAVAAVGSSDTVVVVVVVAVDVDVAVAVVAVDVAVVVVVVVVVVDVDAVDEQLRRCLRRSSNFYRF